MTQTVVHGKLNNIISLTISLTYRLKKQCMKETILNIIQLVLAVVLIAVVLLQQKGTGLSGVFGGSGNIYSTKRGLDKILHYITIVTTTIFFIISLVRLVIQ